MLLWGVVVGVGTGLTAIVLGGTVATRWFTPRRGLVVGMLTASTATGQLMFLPLLAGSDRALRLAPGADVCRADCWRSRRCWRSLLMRDRPSDLGLPPYGETRRGAAAAASASALASLLRGAACSAARGGARADVLGAVRHLLHLRLQHQRPDPDALHRASARDYRLAAVDRRRRAGDDGRVRFRRHHRLGLAVRPLRQSLAAVLVLRAARAVAALPAVHRPSRSTGCRCSPCSTASTGSPPCRRR